MNEITVHLPAYYFYKDITVDVPQDGAQFIVILPMEYSVISRCVLTGEATVKIRTEPYEIAV